MTMTAQDVGRTSKDTDVRKPPERPIAKEGSGKAALIAALLLSVCGCANIREWVTNGFKVGPNYCPPAAPLAGEWIDHADPSVLSHAVDDQTWWAVFNDPILNGFVETAHQQNLSLQSAAARIVEARSRRNIAAGNLFPQTQRALANYAHAQVTRNIGLPLPGVLDINAVGFNASWEADFWGRYRRSIESADAKLDASIESYGNAKVMLISEVATSYIQLRTFQQRLAFARENLNILQRSTDLAQTRFDAGTTTELDLRQAKASLAQTQATIPPLEAGARIASNQLCVLLGMPVNDLAAQLEAAPIPTAPPEIAIGIPADLLRRRPDVRRAERLAAAQCAQIGIAEADFYPRISVSGFIGYVANDFNDVFRGDSFTSFILPSLQWDILNYGRILNNVRAQDALTQAALLDYQQSVLDAGREVEDSLIQFIQAQRQTKALERSVEEYRRAVEIAQTQFEGGVADFNRVYTSQSQLVTQLDQLGTARGSIALYLVQVYKSIGGGWESMCDEVGDVADPQ